VGHLRRALAGPPLVGGAPVPITLARFESRHRSLTRAVAAPAPSARQGIDPRALAGQSYDS